MKVRVVYTKDARKNLHLLQKKEAQKIVLKIQFYSVQEFPIAYAKKLKPPFDDLYRFRIGNYRAVFQVDSAGKIMILMILTIKHRKDVY